MSLDEGHKPPEPDEAAPPAAEAEPPRPKHTIGALLRETREGYGGDINRIATVLRIRAPYLVALEEGRYDRLPAPVYALGFVRAYAIHLGLDGDEAVRRFKQEASGFEIPRDLIFPVPLAERGIPRGPVLAAALLLLLAAYGAWYFLTAGSRVRPERVSEVPAALQPPAATQPEAAIAPAAPPPASVPAPVATTSPPSAPSPPVTLNPPPQQQAAAPPSAPTADDTPHVFGATSGPARIVIHAKGDSWLQVRDKDDTLVFQRLMKDGDVYRVPDRPGLMLFTGNAAVLDVTVDGKPIPALPGTVRHDVRLDPDQLKSGSAVR